MFRMESIKQLDASGCLSKVMSIVPMSLDEETLLNQPNSDLSDSETFEA